MFFNRILTLNDYIMKVFTSLLIVSLVLFSCGNNSNEKSNLVGKKVAEVDLFDGNYELIPCSEWPTRYEVVTFKNESLSVVVDKENDNTLVFADSSELSACAYTLQLKNKQVKSMFNPLNGSHIKLSEFIKGKINNPGEFEPLETRYGLTYETDSSTEEYLFVYMKYRDNESIEYIGAKMKISGDIIETYTGDSLKTALQNFEKQHDASFEF